MTVNEVTIDNGELRLTRLLDAPIETVWAYLTESDKRRDWLAAGAFDLRRGGAGELRFHHPDMACPTDEPPAKYAEHGGDCSETVMSVTITRCEPPRLIAYTWNEGEAPDSELIFALSEENGKTRLDLTHVRLGEDTDMLAGVGAGWSVHTGILEDLLAGRTPEPFWAAHTALEDKIRATLTAQS